MGDLPEEERPPIPDWSAVDDTETYRAVTGTFLWKSNYERILENGVDIAHTPFVHAGAFGNPDKPEMPEFEVETSPWHCKASVKLNPPKPKGIWGRINPDKGDLQEPPAGAGLDDLVAAQRDPARGRPADGQAEDLRRQHPDRRGDHARQVHRAAHVLQGQVGRPRRPPPGLQGALRRTRPSSTRCAPSCCPSTCPTSCTSRATTTRCSTAAAARSSSRWAGRVEGNTIVGEGTGAGRGAGHPVADPQGGPRARERLELQGGPQPASCSSPRPTAPRADERTPHPGDSGRRARRAGGDADHRGGHGMSRACPERPLPPHARRDRRARRPHRGPGCRRRPVPRRSTSPMSPDAGRQVRIFRGEAGRQGRLRRPRGAADRPGQPHGLRVHARPTRRSRTSRWTRSWGRAPTPSTST